LERWSPARVGAAFTDRTGGVSLPPYESLNLGKTDADDPAAVAENFARLREAIGVERVVTCWQTHSSDVLEVDEDFLSGWRPGSELGAALPGQASLRKADALVTTLPRVALCVRVADCVPVLLADAEAGVVAAAHAGRVGLLGGVLEAAAASMRRLGATRIQAWVGPHICGRCYEVPNAMAEDAWTRLPATRAVTAAGTPAIDLGAGARSELERLGCSPVTSCEPCTAETASLFSHRRDAGSTGRQCGLVWLATS
jgi:YfiH family protein